MKPKEFEIKDSGQRQTFDTGAVRDTQEGKPRYDLIPPTALRRVAMHYANGAKKYTERNWEQGMDFSRFYASMFRHMMDFAMGENVEDNLAAVVFNALAIMHFQDMERDDLNNMPDRTPQKKDKEQADCPEPPPGSPTKDTQAPQDRGDQHEVQYLGGF